MATTDLQYLREYSSNDNDFIIEMVELFLNNTPDFLKEMQEAYDEFDYVVVGRVAHKIKPSMTFMGIEDGKELCLELEELGKSKSPDKHLIKMKMDQVRLLCEAAFGELKQSLEEFKA